MPTPEQLRFSEFLQAQGIAPNDVQGVCLQALSYAMAVGKKQEQGRLTPEQALDELQGAQEVVAGVIDMFVGSARPRKARPRDLN